MAKNKTQATPISPLAFIAEIDNDKKKEEAKVLLDLFEKVTGYPSVMWGASIIGYGRYHYKYESGREGDSLITGFSPRKAKHSIYLMDGFDKHTDLLEKLGKFKTSKACLYVNKLADIDLKVLEELIKVSVAAVKDMWEEK